MAVISKPVKMSFIVSKEKTQEFLSQKNNGGLNDLQKHLKDIKKSMRNNNEYGEDINFIFSALTNDTYKRFEE